jgi:hypothetical protein
MQFIIYTDQFVTVTLVRILESGMQIIIYTDQFVTVTLVRILKDSYHIVLAVMCF